MQRAVSVGLFSLEKSIQKCVEEIGKAANIHKNDTFVFFSTPDFPSSSLLRAHRELATALGTDQVAGSVVSHINGKANGFALLRIGKAQLFQIEQERMSRTKTKAVGRWPELTTQLPNLSASSFGLEDEAAVDCIDHLDISVPTGSPFLVMGGTDCYHSLDAIASKYPSSSMIGILGTMTPFVTGYPTTLFFRDQIVPNGLVGCVLDQSMCSKTVLSHNLKPLGDEFEITRAKGNIILQLKGSNAAAQLLKSLNASKTTQVQSLFLAIMENEASESLVFHVTSGDPTKGTLSIDTHHPIKQGSLARFMLHDESVQTTPSAPLVFHVSSTETNPTFSPNHGSLVISSEKGFISRVPGNTCHHCSITGSLLNLMS